MSFARLGRRIGLWCWNVAAVTLVTLALLISLIRTLLPQLDQARDYLIDQAQQRYGVELQLTQLGADWQASGPHLLIDGLTLPAQPLLPFTLDVEQIEVEFNVWESLLTLEPQFDSVSINGVNLDLTLAGGATEAAEADGSDGYNAAALRPLRTLLLEQIEELELADIRLDLQYGERQLAPIHLARWQWRNRDNRHLGQGEVYLDQSRQDNEKLLLSLELQPSGSDGLFGRGYLQAAQLDLGAWMLRNLDDGGSDYAGVLNLESWFSFTESELLQAQWQLDGSHFRWQGEQAHQYTVNQGSFIWLPTRHGWQLNSNPILIANGDNQWPETALHIDNRGGITSLQLDPLALPGLKPMLALIPALSAQQKRDLLQSPSSGTIGPIRAQLRHQPKQLFVDVPFYDLGWQQQGDLPGVAGLSGSLQWLNDHAEFSLNSDQLDLNWPQQLPQPMTLTQFDLLGRWMPQQGESTLQIEQFQLGNDDIELDLQAALLLTPQQAPYLQLGSTLALHNAGVIDNYLPRAMGRDLAVYLGDAIEAGHFDDGRVVWHGALDQYPYRGGQGNFVAGFTMEQLRFDFLPTWPAVEHAKVAARFSNLSMDLQVEQAELAGVELADISVDIPVLGAESELQIEGQLTATAAEVQQVLAPTFLADTVGTTLAVVQPQQPLPITLDMSFNLGKQVKHLPPRVEGVVAFWNTDLFIEPLQLTLEKVRGELHFHNSIIDANNLMATVLNQPTELDVHGEGLDQGYGIDIDLNSRWQISRMPEGLQSPVTSFLDGGAAIAGEIDLLIDEGLSYTGEVRTDLAGIDIALPGPLQKPRPQSRQMELRVRGDGEGADVELMLDQRFGFAGEMVFSGEHLFKRYGLAIEPKQVPLPEQDGAFYWRTDEVQIETWLPLLEALAQPSTGNDSSGKPWFPPLNRVELNANQFALYDLQLGDGQIVATPTDSSWQLQIDTNRAKAEVDLHQTNHQLTIEVVADTLQLADPEMIEVMVVDHSTPTPTPESLPLLKSVPASQILVMPNLNIQVADLRSGKKRLGPAQLVAEREADHYRIKQLTIGPKEHRLQAQGLWLADGNQSRTRLNGSLSTEKSDELLERLALEGSIADATGNLEFELAWQGAPWQVRHDNLSGEFSFELNDGHLKQVSDKGARLLSLFSLESLARKLALDFSDVFGKGMPFEEFEANVALDDGIATTTNAKMDSSAGLMKMSGWTNLHTREIDYKISFSPAIASSLPAVMYLSTGTLAIGLSAFAVTKLLEPVIEVVTQLNYHLSGTLDEPQLEEIERVKQEVEIRRHPQQPESQPEQPESSPSPQTTSPEQEPKDALPPTAVDQPTQPKP